MQIKWISIGFAALVLTAWAAREFLSETNLNLEPTTLSEEETSLLIDIEEAPLAIQPLMKRGFDILFETPKNLPAYAGDRLSCTNCHFSCGNTLGGEQNGFSLVGVTVVYPKTLPNNTLYTLEERINACFLKSMNGKALPIDGEPMKAIVAYLSWISQNARLLPALPWLGVKPLRSTHKSNATHGMEVYTSNCALCHGKKGGGEQRKDDLDYPPLWGDHSFNDAAGMNKVSTLASFIYYNMPYQEPHLTIEDALDVAAYVIEQPRPHYDIP